MAEEITIDKNAFHDRLSSFLTQWKADKRDASFNGVNSIVLPVGKSSGDPNSYTKAAAFQVSSSIEVSQLQPKLTRSIVMAARLRIPAYALRPHARSAPDRHNQEEGCVSTSA